jgi:spermidine synthase
VSTLRAAGLRTTPYLVGGRDAGFAAGPDRTAGASRAPRDWGFVLASVTGTPLRLDPHGPHLRTLTQSSLTADAHAAWRTRVPGLAPSTLVHPRYAD